MRTEGETIAVAGAGYVGLTSALCFCEMGHRVRLVEIDPQRLGQLQRGECPIVEPGLPDLLQRHRGTRLQVTDRLAEAVADARVLFVCVGTPSAPSGAPDLSALRRLLRDLKGLPHPDGMVLVLKSTVPPGTNRMAFWALGGRIPVVSNPEFLREGTAVHDFFHPDRIVVGSADDKAALLVAGLYRGIDAPLVVTGWEEAELIKYAANGFLAIKVSYANEIAALCDALGADCTDVLRGMGLDHRVGSHFLQPGPGFGGSCLPKDTRALVWQARRLGVRLDLLPAALQANRRQRLRILEALAGALGSIEGKQIAVWGLAFKAGTDDLREAASLEMIPWLLRQGAAVRAYDPAAMEGFARFFPAEQWPGLTLCPDPWSALEGADALLILTEWEVFRTADPAAIRRRMAGRVVLDARNLLDPEAAAAAGLQYRGVGRGRKGKGRR
ncbi:MAG TPA: UDP-glucose/GDP-mannose dehydrogenase family protein [Symbiobacteriaceae bacterium]